MEKNCREETKKERVSSAMRMPANGCVEQRDTPL